MNKKSRRKPPSTGADRTKEMPHTGGLEAWGSEKPSRHKWFRKRKKRKDSASDCAEDESDEDRDLEDIRCEHGWSSPRYVEVSTDAHATGEELAACAARQQAWGIASAIDIYDCDSRLIRDAEAIRRFVVELCDLIEMKRFGDTQVVHFGEDERVAGYSMVQLIETSLISGHFANLTDAVYLDVFSCKPYNPQVVREFAQAFFRGKRSSLQVAIRR